MSSIEEIEKEYDIEILRLKEIRLEIEKKKILEKIYVKDLDREIKELKEIETKLEELDIKILRKRYRKKTRGLKVLTEQEIELKQKKQKKKIE